MNNSPYLSRYRNGEYLQYMKDILKLLDLKDLETLKLTNPTNTLREAVVAINDVFQQEKGSDITLEIKAFDDRRDKAITGLKTTVNGLSYHFDPVTANAAQSIVKNIELYGSNIARRSYQEETIILSSIVEDLETKAELIAAVTTLELASWVEELKIANEDCANKYIERVGEAAANPSANNPELKFDATLAYRSLLKHIVAHETLTDVVTYTSLLNEIDVLAKQYNQVVDNRTKNNTSDDGEPTPDDDSEE
ncbi:conserved hypothetical protein [Tenacibaculum sp. 190524A02b]|uniref:Uncharacterized protein n=1 Tax=Tenacibaculum vairaonense TaxID=3137860 RepID=A0ABM9PIX9_9FLAO